jgi:hypothetical protein
MLDNVVAQDGAVEAYLGWVSFPMEFAAAHDASSLLGLRASNRVVFPRTTLTVDRDAHVHGREKPDPVLGP